MTPLVPLLAGLAAGLALGLGLAWRELRRQRRELARLRDEARELQAGARLLADVRHRCATPLQTIEVTSALLRRRCAEAAPAIDRMDTALARLRELTGLLAVPGPLVRGGGELLGPPERDAARPGAPPP